MSRTQHRAFTLIELLVVLALSAVLALAFVVRPNAVGSAAALAAAEAMTVAFVNAARLRAIAAGADVRLLIALDRRGTIILQSQRPDQSWATVEIVRLPERMGIARHASRNEAAAISSSALAGPTVATAAEGDAVNLHEALVISAHGTTGTSGNLAVVPETMAGNSSAPSFREIVISSYGVAIPQVKR